MFLPLFDSNPRNVVAPVTLTAIVGCMVVFAFQLLLAQQGTLDVFVLEYAFTPAAVGQRPPTEILGTALTSVFLHASLLHLAANLWFLFIFGPPVEHRLGSLKTLIIFLLGALAAAFTQYIVSPDSTVPMIGASGAVAAILGTYLMLFPFAMVVTLVPWIIPLLPIPAFVFLILWFAFQFMMGVTQMMETDITGGVAWWAHIGGFVAGVFLVILLPGDRRRR